MFSIEDEGKVHYVSFMHFSPRKAKDHRCQPGTTAILRSGPVGTKRKDCEQVIVADANLYAKDTFNKAQGRKYALTKLLREANVPYEFRKKVWQAYWTKTKTKP